MQEEAQKSADRKAELEHLVTERTNQLVVQNKKLQTALAELKTTQAQLIQSEKMANLGELTAGIAHEIQNPLNFVNNFSSLNTELVDEILAVRNNQQGINEDKMQEEILHNLKENSLKIYTHGQRASSIVKGMLEHSRKSTGIREPTDINALCEEYLKLSYQAKPSTENSLSVDSPSGRAGQAGFHSYSKFDLDPNLPKLNIAQQDIGRVWKPKASLQWYLSD